MPLIFGSIKFTSGGCKFSGRLLAICRAVASFVTLLSSIVFIFFNSVRWNIRFGGSHNTTIMGS